MLCCLAVQDREVIGDLMTRLEARTTERHEALQAAAAAEARLKVGNCMLWHDEAQSGSCLLQPSILTSSMSSRIASMALQLIIPAML